MNATSWKLPVDLLTQSVQIMRPNGALGNEGLALWFGTADESVTTVSHVVEVYGQGFKTSPLHMSLSYGAMSKLTDLAETLNCCLVGQIHSHPERFLDLSLLDRQQGIRVPDYLSVVCPHYAQSDVSKFAECGVHVFEKVDYRRLTAAEIASRIVRGDEKVKRLKCEVPL